MAAFVVSRLIGAVLVLVAVSFIVFVIFIIIPGGDPATRIAGKNATDENIANIRETWGFDQPFYVQYGKMMQKVFTGDLVSYTTQQDVVQEIKAGLPATFSLGIGAAIIWLFFGVLVGVDLGGQRGEVVGPAITILALIGISMPVFWLGILARYFLAGERGAIFPDGGYVPLTDNPARVVLPPDPAVVRARRALHRLLRARAALEHPRHDQRGLRAHRAREGPRPAARAAQARAAQLADPDRDALRARLRGSARRRRDPHRDRLRPAGRRPVRGAVGRQPRPPADHGRDALRRVLHRLLQRDRRLRLRIPRPADPADASGRTAARGQGTQGPVRDRGRHRAGGRRRRLRRSSAARCSASSASPARARASPR